MFKALNRLWRAWAALRETEEGRWNEAVGVEPDTPEPEAPAQGCATKPKEPTLEDLIRDRQQETKRVRAGDRSAR